MGTGGGVGLLDDNADFFISDIEIKSLMLLCETFFQDVILGGVHSLFECCFDAFCESVNCFRKRVSQVLSS